MEGLGKTINPVQETDLQDQIQPDPPNTRQSANHSTVICPILQDSKSTIPMANPSYTYLPNSWVYLVSNKICNLHEWQTEENGGKWP
jgi:hypothetical protein